MSETWWVSPDELIDEQKAVISLPLSGSHLITGPPGSGKTNLLLLRANFMYLAGKKNILILVFTSTLRDFIVAGSSQYDFPSDKIQTSSKWLHDLLFHYGIKPALPEDFDQAREQLIQMVNQLIAEKNLGKIYDAILLDEAQDYTPGEIDIFKRLSKDLYAVADGRQKIYDCLDSQAALQAATEHHHALEYHFRCGRNICRLADLVAKDSDSYSLLLPFSQYHEKPRPSSVEFHQCGNIQEEGRKIVGALTIQLDAYPGELLGVICPRNSELKQMFDIIQNSSLGRYATLLGRGEFAAFDTDARICLSTLHGAKGLEFRALHFAGTDYLTKFPFPRNIAYTAITRAKTSLAVYCSTKLVGFFEQALSSVSEPEPNLPNLKDVFGRG